MGEAKAKGCSVQGAVSERGMHSMGSETGIYQRSTPESPRARDGRSSKAAVHGVWGPSGAHAPRPLICGAVASSRDAAGWQTPGTAHQP